MPGRVATARVAQPAVQRTVVPATPMVVLVHPQRATVAAALAARVRRVLLARLVQLEPQPLAQVRPVAQQPAAQPVLAQLQAVVPVALLQRPQAAQGALVQPPLVVQVAQVLSVPREPVRVVTVRKVPQVVRVVTAAWRRTTAVRVALAGLRAMVMSPMAVQPMAVPQPETVALVVLAEATTVAVPADRAEP
jgi:hypothetical protein